jgi:hypothetical protein
MTPILLKAAIARLLAVHGIEGARLSYRKADYLSHDSRPIVFVLTRISPVAAAGLHLAFDSDVRLVTREVA